MIVGAHIRGEDPLAEAGELGAGCIQMFVGPPQSWKKPPPRADADLLRQSPLPIYVHAPYLINVASPNNRVRIPSRKILAGSLERAAEIGATALIVHAGHSEDGVERGFRRWWKVFEEMDECPVPIYIENTAGGTNAMGRRIEVLAELWKHLEGFEVGFCFDTCHAHAAGEELADVVPRVLEATGRIDLVHANSSRDRAGSGADRHENFDAGTMDVELIADMVKASGAPAVICETPPKGIATDLAFLRARVAAL
ncbi:MAG: deoxyribonuclease IV [Actinomycetota bacterium]